VPPNGACSHTLTILLLFKIVIFSELGLPPGPPGAPTTRKVSPTFRGKERKPYLSEGGWKNEKFD